MIEINSAIDDVINQWPREIIVDTISIDSCGRFSVHAAYDISDGISSKYIGNKFEIIYRNLCDSVYEVIHDSAEFCPIIRVAELRRSAIKDRLRKRLAKIVSVYGLGWDDADINAAEYVIAKMNLEKQTK